MDSQKRLSPARRSKIGAQQGALLHVKMSAITLHHCNSRRLLLSARMDDLREQDVRLLCCSTMTDGWTR